MKTKKEGDIMEKELVLLELINNVCRDILCVSMITSIEVPMLTKINKVNYDKLVNLRYTGIDSNKSNLLNINILDNRVLLEDIYNKLKDYTSPNNMKNISRNIKNVELNKKSLLYLIGWKGAYNAKNNEIKYASNDAISHEFLHMASAFYDSKEETIYDGFLVSNKKDGKVGIGLNEGYTELLASRIYRNNKVKAYKKEVNIASIIEEFFYNKKDMEDYYFNHDLPGFIFYLSQYTNKNELIKLIKDIDNITNTNKLLSASPNYYYLKVLNRLNKMSDSNNLSSKQKENIKAKINKNMIMNIDNKVLIKK